LNEHAHQVWSEGSLALYYAAPAQVLPPALANLPLTENSGGQGKAPLPFRTFLPLTAHNLDAGAQAGYERAARTDVRFGGKLQLEGVALANVEPAVGEAVLLLTKWRALQDIPHGLVVQLELIDPAGEMWGEYQFRIGPAHSHTRGWSASETFVERRGLVIPVGTPPGDYVLRVRVCRPHGYDCDEWPLQGADAFEVGPFRASGSVTPRALAALPGHDLHVTFEDTLALVGYEPWGSSFTQGNPLFFNLYWQALVYPPEDYEVGIELVDRDAAVLVEGRAQPVADWFPTSHWRAGDVLLGRYALPLPLDAPPGRYQIRLSVYTPDGAPLAVGGTREVEVLDWWCREQAISGTEVSLFEVQIEARPRLYRPPAMDHRVDAVLGDDVRLLGYDLAAASVRPGDSVKLTLYWQALRRIERMYAVFCHLVDPAGTVVTQADGWPQDGAYPTLQWLPGEVVEDSYTIPLPPDARAGEYTLLVGMYDAETGERPATMVDGTLVPERYVTLTTITVEE
jgi:hypothetical protein